MPEAEGDDGRLPIVLPNIIADTGPRPIKVRKNPCASCPFRQDVPSGVWAQEEYDALPKWDGDLMEQAEKGVADRTFYCHQASGDLCAGWVGHRDEPADLLSLRMHSHKMDESVWTYTTMVPLFASGAEAREHGLREIDAPSPKAREVIKKVVSTRLGLLESGTKLREVRR